jgi:hypothetical protein
LKPAFKNSPLAADFERWNLSILNHTMQSSFGNLEDCCGFGEGQEFYGGVGFFHRFHS